VRHRRRSHSGGPSRRRWFQLVFDGIGYFIGIGEEQTHLPHLGIVQCVLKFRHSRQPDSVRYLPVSFASRIIGHALAFEKRRGLGKHSLCHGCLVDIRQPMADGASILINFRAGKICVFIGGDWNRLGHFLLYVRIERLVGEELLHRHRLVFDGSRRRARHKVITSSNSDQNNSNNDAGEKRFHATPSLKCALPKPDFRDRKL
jgi:hypothetical protein